MASQTLTEWSEARTIIGRFDNNLHDLRKYGFSFVTGILTADAILSHSFVSATAEITWYEKWAILFVTAGLILALRLLDQQYRLFQRAASQRAIILEERMSIDLTEDFSTLYKLGGWAANIENLYDGFLILTFILGWAILIPNYQAIFFLALVIFLASCLREVINGMDVEPVMDWSVDSAAVRVGVPLRITLTNLDKILARNQPTNPLRRMYRRWTGPWRRIKKAVLEKDSDDNDESKDARHAESTKVKDDKSSEDWDELRKWDVAWAIFSEGGDVVDSLLREVVLDYSEYVNWLWNTTDMPSGLYTLVMSCVQAKPRSRRQFWADRLIQVVDAPASTPSA